jgi:hypothetical protein
VASERLIADESMNWEDDMAVIEEESGLGNLRVRLQPHLDRITAGATVPGVALELSVGGSRLSFVSGTTAIDTKTPMTRHAGFRLGQSVRLVVAAMTLQAEGERKLSLDDRIGDHLPELAASHVGQQVRIWHLLTHSAGYRDMSVYAPAARTWSIWSDVARFLASTPLQFEPGTVFSQSSTQFVILGEILSRLYSTPIGNLIEDALRNRRRGGVESNVADHRPGDKSAPAMRSEALKTEPLWSAAFSARTLSPAMLVDLIEHLRTERIDGASLLARLAGERTVAVPTATGSRAVEPLPVRSAFGCASDRRGWTIANGPLSGQLCTLAFDATAEMSIAIGMNVHRPLLRERLFDVLGAELPGLETARAAAAVDVSPAFLPEEIVGVYEGPVGLTAQASLSGEHVLIRLEQPYSDTQLEPVRLTCNEAGVWCVDDDRSALLAGFFREPATSTAALMIGSLAFKKHS